LQFKEGGGMNKNKQKWTNKRSRIIDALESNVYENQLESMISNISLLRTNEWLSVKNQLLFLALKNASKDCAEFLLSKGATANNYHVLTKCDWKKMHSVFNLLEELNSKYQNEEFRDQGQLNKIILIRRLIDHSKIEANKERLDYLFNLIHEEFLKITQVKNVIEDEYKDKPEKKIKFVALYRELTLKELGID
jgi:hypothetical protein